ncbi:MAG: hypothetical protein IJ003_02010 [Candidatus Gastranaerophilales bacterium]|nr:hypothetical protein [Candidatus Gastranaerophilales bacterium]
MKINVIKLYNLKPLGKVYQKEPNYCVINFLNKTPEKDIVCFSGKKKNEKSKKLEILTRNPINDKDLAFIKKQNEDYLDKLIELTKYDDIVKHAIEIVNQGDEAYQRALELTKNGMSLRGAKRLTTIPKRNYQKATFAIRKKEPILIDPISVLSDEQFAKLYKYTKQGISISVAYELSRCDEKQRQRILDLLKKGANDETAISLGRCSDEKYNEFKELLKQGISICDAHTFAFIPPRKEKFESLKKENFSPFIAATMAGFQLLDTLNSNQKKHLARFIETLKANLKDTKSLSYALSSKLSILDISKLDIESIADYAANIDYKKLYKTVPSMKSYDARQFIDFIYFHYLKQTKEFNKETLTFRDDMTEYLENNYISAEKLDDILMAYPLTPREVGEIPQDWLDKAEDKTKAKKEIYKAIQRFQNDKNEEIFAKNLTNTLNKKTKIRWVGRGSYGDVYKIEIENAKETCIKIFKGSEDTFCAEIHGRNIEPQTGLFLNKHSNKFVKTYFGKICDEKRRDGFMVTQFLSDTITPEENELISNQDNKIKYCDPRNCNAIHGKIIDIGGVIFDE